MKNLRIRKIRFFAPLRMTVESLYIRRTTMTQHETQNEETGFPIQLKLLIVVIGLGLVVAVLKLSNVF
jgi:hypothetical protein